MTEAFLRSHVALSSDSNIMVNFIMQLSGNVQYFQIFHKALQKVDKMLGSTNVARDGFLEEIVR